MLERTAQSSSVIQAHLTVHMYEPQTIAAELSDLRHWSVMPRGGHFAAAEQPSLVVEELGEFFGSLP